MELLTSSRLSTLRQCPRKHYYRYELALRPVAEQNYFRIGSVFHHGLELLNAGKDRDTAITEATKQYTTVPQWANPDDWKMERAVVATLLAGHAWRYEADKVTVLAEEQTFDLPLVNPETGGTSRTFRLGGKIDAIVRMVDGRVAVQEYKTCGDDIAPDAPYWLRLRCDPQISIYYLAAQQLQAEGVSTILYDVTKKPTIRPSQIPLLDAVDGMPIVLDATGDRVFTKQGKPRQTASSADGYVLQTRTETADEFADRLLKDIGDRPDYYYQRREVPRLEDEMEAFQWELWQQAQNLSAIRLRSAKSARPDAAWFRSVGRWNCDGCEFAGPCLGNIAINPGDVPTGFAKVDDVNAELA